MRTMDIIYIILCIAGGTLLVLTDTREIKESIEIIEIKLDTNYLNKQEEICTLKI